MLVLNKWNKKTYEVMAKENGKVILKRKDGTIFTIAEKEYFANYIEKSA